MGSKKSVMYQEFVTLCCRIFNVLRRNADLFITLFHMMTLTGIPELRSEADIKYLRSALHLEMTEVEAARKFTKLIDEAYNSKATTLNHWIHSGVHK